MDAVENLKAISEYLSSRPELIGVGKKFKTFNRWKGSFYWNNARLKFSII